MATVDKRTKINVTCPSCRLVVELVVRELSVTARGNGTVEATVEASSYKHACEKLGGGF